MSALVNGWMSSKVKLPTQALCCDPRIQEGMGLSKLKIKNFFSLWGSPFSGRECPRVGSGVVRIGLAPFHDWRSLLLARAVFSVSLLFTVYVVFCNCLVVSTSAIDCLERLVSEMTYYVLSQTHSGREFARPPETCLE